MPSPFVSKKCFIRVDDVNPWLMRSRISVKTNGESGKGKPLCGYGGSVLLLHLRDETTNPFLARLGLRILFFAVWIKLLTPPLRPFRRPRSRYKRSHSLAVRKPKLFARQTTEPTFIPTYVRKDSICVKICTFTNRTVKSITLSRLSF
jgi:hypothetical protein